MTELPLDSLHPALQDPILASMTFLSETADRYPDAVSFAAGRPYAASFDPEDLHRYLRTFRRHLTEEHSLTERQTADALFQYGRTKGLIHELIARHLRLDEGVNIDPDAVVVTVGCQEAIFLVLQTLRSSAQDAVLAVAPTYVGLSGAARLTGLPVLPVTDGPRGIDLDDLRQQATRARARGLRPRALYLVPDFANPSGTSLDHRTRVDLLDLAAELDVLVLEDSPYALFHGVDYQRPPSLKALDTREQVIQLGSYAKTMLPGARVGYIVADQPVTVGGRRTGLLADQLAKTKSMVTVNTSPVAQALVAGRLLEHGGSLTRANTDAATTYQRNLRHLLNGLDARFGSGPAAGRVRWNTPHGGFFTVLTVPFTADDELLRESAERYGVLWTPMSHFYDGPGAANRLRLSCSDLDPDRIDLGLDRLARLVTDRIAQRTTPAPDLPSDPTSTPVQRMMNLLHGALTTQLLAVAAEFGIADLLADGPLPVPELARRCGANPEALHRVLRALATQDVFQELGRGVFALTPMAETLRGDVPGSVREWTRFWGLPERLQAINSLSYSVRTGLPAFPHLHGTDWWSHLAAHPEQAEVFNNAMGDLSRRIHSAALETCNLSGARHVVDVGGGHGHLLATLLPRYPHLRATLLDRPAVVAGAQPVLDAAGVAGRVQLVGGDFFDRVPEGADVYLLSMILHDWDDARCAGVLGTIRRVMAPGARILVIDAIVPEGNAPHDGKLRDAIMMALHPGRERTEAEFAALFAAAGLRHTGTTAMSSSTGLLTAEAAP